MSWNTLTITSGFYLYAVLNLGTSRGNLSIKGAPLLWVIRTLQREADAAFQRLVDHRHVIDEKKQSSELLLWTMFMGSITVAGLHHSATTSDGLECNMPGGEFTFQELLRWFALRIRNWSDFSGVTSWEGQGGARDSLAAVVWPMQSKVEPLAKAIWEEAVGPRHDK